MRYFFRIFYDVCTNFRKRLIFRDFEPPPRHLPKNKKSRILFDFSVGQLKNIEDGISVNGSLSKITDLNSFCKKMEFPSDFGSVFSIDVGLKFDASEENVKMACESIETAVRNHFEGEPLLNSFFRSRIFVRELVRLLHINLLILLVFMFIS